MSFLRPLAGTTLTVSALGLGTVKLGRNQGVKYPSTFDLPDDQQVRELLACARDLDICLLDTAPAYGSSEERLGELLERREDWIIVTKTGEEFEGGRSHFDFSAGHTRFSLERSLKRLKTDYLDLVLIHSDGQDLDILDHSDCVATLKRCQEQGLVRYIGMSSKTIAGGLRAAELLDVVMITWNLEQQDRAVADYAYRHDKGILVKKALMSGNVAVAGQDPVTESFRSVFSHPGVDSTIVGTLNPAHLKHNVSIVKEVVSEVVT